MLHKQFHHYYINNQFRLICQIKQIHNNFLYNYQTISILIIIKLQINKQKNSINKKEEKKQNKMQKNNSLPQLFSLPNYQQLKQSPIIKQLLYYHQQNKSKLIKSKQINHHVMKNFQLKKISFIVKDQLKNQLIAKKLKQLQNQKIAQIKLKNQYVNTVLNKFHQLTQQQHNLKLNKINQKFIAIHRNKSNNYSNCCTQVSTNRQKCMTNSLDLRNSQQSIKFKKIQSMPYEILQKYLEKQKQAENRRKQINQNRKIKYLNIIKQQRRIKAVEYLQNKQNQTIQKSIQKFQCLQKQNEKYIMRLKQKQNDRKFQSSQLKNKFKSTKIKQQQTFKQKLIKLQQLVKQKNQKANYNKQTITSSVVNHHRQQRLHHQNQIQTRFNTNHSCFSSRMTQIYNKDRQQWTFVTNVNHLKNALIQKNIYQNNQASLNKSTDF